MEEEIEEVRWEKNEDKLSAFVTSASFVALVDAFPRLVLSFPLAFVYLSISP